MTKVTVFKAAQGLTLYETASRALAACRTVDEVKTWHDKAAALQEYARRAKDGTLIAEAVEVRELAERRLGEVIAEHKGAGGLAHTGRPPKIGRSGRPISLGLDELGVSKDLSSRSQKKAALPEAKFKALVAERARLAKAAAEGDREIVKAAKAHRHAEVRARRKQREEELAGRILKLPQKRYGVILADPEWRFETYSDAGKTNTSAENHYPTSSLEEIKRRDVASIAAKDCSLWLWSTGPMLPQALEVMAAWGFEYRARVVWGKLGNPGTGYWFRDRAEELLLGIRGNVPAPAPGDQWESLITSPKGRHSEKPDWQYALIEAYFPNVPKLELNARKARKGWDAWGLEAPIAAAAE
jgi:N6-adenosine-specific RNA methylase IME4